MHLDRGAVAALVHRPAGQSGRPASGSRSSTPTTSSGASRTSSPSSPTCGSSSRPTRRSAGCSPTTATATPGATRRSASRRCSTRPATSSTDPGRYQNLTDDFSAQINAFKAANAEIVTGVVIPPDFTTFWNQAQAAGLQAEGRHDRQGAAVPAVGRGARRRRQQPVDRGVVVAQPSVQVVADRPELGRSSPTPSRKATGRQWTQPIGFVHALFEVAADVLKRAADPGDRRRRGRRRSRPPSSTPSSARSTGTARAAAVRRQERRQDAAGRRPVAAQGRRRLRPGHRRQQDGARNPAAGKMEPIA